MISQLFKKKKDLTFERTYAHPVDAVWTAWTDADALRSWWGPAQTTIPACEVDLRVGGTIHIVTEAGEGMGTYQGTRWPMEGTFTAIEVHRHLAYDARSWTEGEEATSTIHHVNDLTFSERDGRTTVALHIAITQIGPRAKMAAFGMKMGYKQYLDNLAEHLDGRR